MAETKTLEKNESLSIVVNEHRGNVHPFKTKDEAINFLEGLHEQGKTGEIIITFRTYERIRIVGWHDLWK